MSLKQLDSIAEGVGSKDPIETVNRFRIVIHFEACGSQRFESFCEIPDEKSRMRSPGWAKVGLDAKV